MTRVTTFVCRQLTLPALASVHQHSGADNVHHYVTAYWNILPQSVKRSRNVRTMAAPAQKICKERSCRLENIIGSV